MRFLSKEKRQLLANCLTIIRALIGLPLILALTYDSILIAWILLVISALTDIFDGLLARNAYGGSSWGARYDPLADKILMLAPLIWLAKESILPIWSVWLLISRELTISSWRADRSQGGPASKAGKAKTILQFIGILMLLWPNEFGGNELKVYINEIGLWIFWPSLILAFSSALTYIISSTSNHHN